MNTMTANPNNDIVSTTESLIPKVYERFKFFYQDYGDNSLNLLQSIYSSNVNFKDPNHEIQGLNELTQYFDKGRQNLIQCRFDFLNEMLAENEAYITWDMTFQHKRIQKGKSVTVRGMSHIEFDDQRITLHEDVFDLGAMIYENIPVAGKLVRAIKSKL